MQLNNMFIWVGFSTPQTFYERVNVYDLKSTEFVMALTYNGIYKQFVKTLLLSL